MKGEGEEEGEGGGEGGGGKRREKKMFCKPTLIIRIIYPVQDISYYALCHVFSFFRMLNYKAALLLLDVLLSSRQLMHSTFKSYDFCQGIKCLLTFFCLESNLCSNVEWPIQVDLHLPRTWRPPCGPGRWVREEEEEMAQWEKEREGEKGKTRERRRMRGRGGGGGGGVVGG